MKSIALFFMACVSGDFLFLDYRGLWVARLGLRGEEGFGRTESQEEVEADGYVVFVVGDVEGDDFLVFLVLALDE